MSSYEIMGDLPAILTTTPWQSRLAEKIYADTGDSAVKSFFGPQGWNASLIDKMNTLYKADILPGADRELYIKSNAGVSDAVAESFMKNISLFEGQSVKEGPAATVENVLEGIGSTAKTLPAILWLLAAGIAGYFLLAGKHGVKLTP